MNELTDQAQATETTPATCQDRTGCTGDQEVGLRTGYGEWRLCEAHALERYDALDPKRRRPDVTVFHLH